jgi:SAM-dependent methyltransferase
MDETVKDYYSTGVELGRVAAGSSRIEFERTKELLERYLPPAPARVLDVGGGPGVYADWLADLGYGVKLVDVTPLHVEQATEVAQGRFLAEEGDARLLRDDDASFDVVLLLGPLYHLVERSERLLALAEARRVVRSGGLVAAAAISRLAPLLDGLISGHLRDPAGRARVGRTLETGAHRSPPGRTDLFTTAYFHRPEELAAEVVEAGLRLEGVFGLEGPGWLRDDTLADEAAREDVSYVARVLEREPTAIGVSAHLLAIAHRPGRWRSASQRHEARSEHDRAACDKIVEDEREALFSL